MYELKIVIGLLSHNTVIGIQVSHLSNVKPFKDEVFCISPKWLKLKNYWYHQSVLLKSFPMNGHVRPASFELGEGMPLI
jgi:hypothetical protein